jgi:hypothetical protein
MGKLQISTKRLAISKASAQMMTVVSVAAFVTVFSLVSCQALLSQRNYRGRVISEKEKVHAQLQKDIEAVESLVDSYKKFNNQPVNVIGGSASGNGDRDGNNARIILDALPSKYDFPGLTSSLEKIMKDRGVANVSITGTDDEVAQQTAASAGAVPIPFTLAVTKINYATAQQILLTLEKSIRPIQIDNMTLSGGSRDMSLTITAHTYYQPSKEYKFETKVVQ